MRRFSLLVILAAGSLPAQQGPGSELSVQEESITFAVQRWLVRDAAAPERSTNQQAVVGSVLPDEKIAAGVLIPANDSASESPSVLPSTANGNTFRRWSFSEDILVEATYTRSESQLLEISGSITNAGKARDIPLTLTMYIPVPGTDRLWLSNLHDSLAADGPEERIEAVSTTAGARGAMSRYPFGGIAIGNMGIGVALPLDQPRIHRIRWDGERESLAVDLDVTLSPVTTKFPNRADFTFFVFGFDGEFGFRGMAARYYELMPQSFTNRVRRQGQWMPFTQVDTVQRVEDFGFAYHEYHPNVSVAYNSANGIESLVYCEPPVQYVHLAPGAPRTLDHLKSLIESAPGVQGAQIRSSVTHDATGDIQAAWVDTPWAVGSRVPTNGDPDIPRTDRDRWNSFDANWKPYIDLYRDRAEDRPVGWDGVAKTIEGVIGAHGRALMIPAGGTASHPIGNAATDTTLTFRAKGTPGSTLIVEAGTSRQEFQPTTEFTNHTARLTANAGDIVVFSAVGGDVYTDDVAADGKPLPNGDFESGVRDPERVTGLYLDSFEGWDSKDLNFRADHFPFVDIPLTFDARTGRTAQVNMMHSFEFAAEARRRLERRGHLLMANTALYQWSWSAHYLDVLGIESSWGEGARINPPQRAEMDYVRTMLRQKPYCYLLNVQYSNFRGPIVEQYFARCLHWGFWPGFFSHNAAESPYWHDPDLYNADRPVFLRYTSVQRRLTESGWEPLTMARVDHPDLLVERWGGGPWIAGMPAPTSFSHTVYNPTDGERTATLAPDVRLTAGADYIALDLLTGRRIPVSRRNAVSVSLRGLGVAAILFVRDDADSLALEYAHSIAELQELSEKYQRHGMLNESLGRALRAALIDSASRAGIDAAERSVASAIDNVYTEEWTRAVTRRRVTAAAAEEARTGRRFAPRLPASLVVGETVSMAIDSHFGDLKIAAKAGDRELPVQVAAGEASFAIPADVAPDQRATVFIGPASADRVSPWFEASLPILAPVSFPDLAQRLTLTEPTEYRVAVRNNLPREVKGRLVVQGPGGVELRSVDPMVLGPETTVQTSIQFVSVDRLPTEDRKGSIVLEWIREGRSTADHRADIPVTVLAQNASLLRHADVTTRVDSFYFGYDERALNDGVVDGRNLDWRDAAWASEEAMVPHWAEFTFAQPREVREVTIHWALDAGQHWTSREVRVEGRSSEQEPWRVLAIHRGGADVPSTRLSFDPVSIRSIRLYQAAGEGPTTRPGILWLSEVEAR